MLQVSRHPISRTDINFTIITAAENKYPAMLQKLTNDPFYFDILTKVFFSGSYTTNTPDQ
jgi:hypothetical protein